VLLRRLTEKKEKILQILNALAEESAKGTLILVEGKKDVEALRAFGVEGRVMTVKTGGKSFLDVVSELETAEVAEVLLLLDFDRRGKEGTARLRRSLECAGIKSNVEYWRGLSFLLGNEVQCVEGLPAYMETLRSKVGASAG
jgi:5S rRNA maturation endonuclease (ribonuclease M5)